MKISDSNFRKNRSEVHPYFEPYLVFNDKKGSPTIYFESKYNNTEYCKKVWGISPKELNLINPLFYHWPEKEENKIIVIKQGGHGRIPHGFYVVHTTDGGPATYSVRSENEL